MEEEYKPIIGFEGYFISNLGNVKTCKKRNERIMKPQLSREGYWKVNLWDGECYNRAYIHRLIAIHFIPNPDNKPEVDHIDRNPKNNSISNLRWVTQSENKINRNHRLGPLNERYIRHFPNKPSPYGVTITRDRKTIFCKYFKTLDEAIQARDSFLASY